MTKTNRRADSGVSILNLPVSKQSLLPLYRLITVSVRSSCAELEPT